MRSQICAQADPLVLVGRVDSPLNVATATGDDTDATLPAAVPVVVTGALGDNAGVVEDIVTPVRGEKGIATDGEAAGVVESGGSIGRNGLCLMEYLAGVGAGGRAAVMERGGDTGGAEKQ